MNKYKELGINVDELWQNITDVLIKTFVVCEMSIAHSIN